MSERICKNCEWWNKKNKDCHRYPPQEFDIGAMKTSKFPHPPESEYDWCGEFEAKK